MAYTWHHLRLVKSWIHPTLASIKVSRRFGFIIFSISAHKYIQSCMCACVLVALLLLNSGSSGLQRDTCKYLNKHTQINIYNCSYIHTCIPTYICICNNVDVQNLRRTCRNGVRVHCHWWIFAFLDAVLVQI